MSDPNKQHIYNYYHAPQGMPIPQNLIPNSGISNQIQQIPFPINQILPNHIPSNQIPQNPMSLNQIPQNQRPQQPFVIPGHYPFVANSQPPCPPGFQIVQNHPQIIQGQYHVPMITPGPIPQPFYPQMVYQPHIYPQGLYHQQQYPQGIYPHAQQIPGIYQVPHSQPVYVENQHPAVSQISNQNSHLQQYQDYIQMLKNEYQQNIEQIPPHKQSQEVNQPIEQLPSPKVTQNLQSPPKVIQNFQPPLKVIQDLQSPPKVVQNLHSSPSPITLNQDSTIYPIMPEYEKIKDNEQKEELISPVLTKENDNPSSAVEDQSIKIEEDIHLEEKLSSLSPKKSPSQDSTPISEHHVENITKKTLIPMGENSSLKVIAIFNSYKDAHKLKNAFEENESGTHKIIKIITHRSSEQKEEIKSVYKKLFGQCLTDKMRIEISDPLLHILVSLMYSGAKQDAYLLRKATKSRGAYDDIFMQMIYTRCSDDMIIHIICTRSYEQILDIKEAFYKMYGKRLIESVSKHMSGNYRRVINSLIEKSRKKSAIDEKCASETANNIHDTNANKSGAPENLIEKLCSCDREQLILINKSFTTQFSMPLYKFLKSYKRGNYEDALITMCHYINDPIDYYVKLLRKYINKQLILGISMVFSTRCEIDLGKIAEEYKKKYKVALNEDIQQAFNQSFPKASEALELVLGL